MNLQKYKKSYIAVIEHAQSHSWLHGRCKNGRCGKDFPEKVKTMHCLLHICLDVYVYGYTIVISVRIRTVGMCTRRFCVCILINFRKIFILLVTMISRRTSNKSVQSWNWGPLWR